MDIKLKSFSRNRAAGTIAFFLCVVLFLATLVSGTLMFQKATNTTNSGMGVDELLLYGSYEKSAAFQREFSNKLGDILYMLDHYKSEEYIKSGKTIDDQRLDDAMRNMYYGVDTGISYSYGGSNGSVPSETNTITATDVPPVERYGGREYDEPNLRQQFMRDYAVQIDELKKTMSMDDLRAYESYQKELNKTEGFSYLATDGTYTLMNSASSPNTPGTAVDITYFKKAPAYLIYEDDHLTKVPGDFKGVNGSMENFDRSLEGRLDEHYNPTLKVYFSFDQDYLTAKEAEFAKAKSELLKWMPMAIFCGLLSLILLIYLVITTGKKDEEGNYPAYKVDKIFTELQLFIIGFLLIGGGSMFLRFLTETVNYGVYLNGNIYTNNDPVYLSAALATLIGLFAAGFGLYFILSVVRNIKAGRFLKNSLIFIVVSSLWKGLKAFYFGGSLMKKVVLITLAICILSATVMLAPVAAALIIIFAPKWVKKYEEIKKGVDEV
ncbi:MAG TPA: hypothetical protein VM577_12660, partial [Anaerovoracaceae bacterium]|nr:hypothetical protein [Anaerovoracaceae bacterium]